MPGTGQIVRWLTISCGSCDASDAFAMARDTRRTEAVGRWMLAGWRTERADNEHKDSWWACPACLSGQGGK